ncbi:hypothetical protein GN956_G8957 [Arapaima gigas]
MLGKSKSLFVGVSGRTSSQEEALDVGSPPPPSRRPGCVGPGRRSLLSGLEEHIAELLSWWVCAEPQLLVVGSAMWCFQLFVPAVDM